MARVTDAKLRSIKGIRGKAKIERVGGGLELWVTVNQAQHTTKKWVLRYYDANGKRQKARIGEYPDLTLAKAVALAEDLKKVAKEGVNISQKMAKQRQSLSQEYLTEQTNTFESIASEWLDKKSLDWSASHSKRQRERLFANIFPVFGSVSINDITMQDIDNSLLPIIARGSRETAQRICTIIKSIFEYADTMTILSDPTIIFRLERYKKEMPKPADKRHLYKDMSEDEIGQLLQKIDESKMRWTIQTSVALRLAPYVMLRPSELCGGLWEEIDFDNAEWVIPAERMKAKREHIVPLSSQALKLLKEILSFSGNGRYVFPSLSKKKQHISTASLIQALRRLGYASTQSGGNSFTTHGFRGMASTTLHQRLSFNSDLIELQLSHVEQNKVKAAYNQITSRSYLEERRKMVQYYSDYLDKLKFTIKP